MSTDQQPGTPEKIQVMTERETQKESCFHRDDPDLRFPQLNEHLERQAAEDKTTGPLVKRSGEGITDGDENEDED